MHMKFIPLGLVASALASVSARSLYTDNSVAFNSQLKNSLVARSGTVSATGNQVGVHDSASDILNYFAIYDVLNNLNANVVSDDNFGASRGHISGSHVDNHRGGEQGNS